MPDLVLRRARTRRERGSTDVCGGKRMTEVAIGHVRDHVAGDRLRKSACYGNV